VRLCRAFSPSLACFPEYRCLYLLSLRVLKRTMIPHGDDVADKRKRKSTNKGIISIKALLKRSYMMY
jgi:hypothetical protein